MEMRLARHCRHVAVVTIDHQRRLNAMTRQMQREVGRPWDELGRDECRCIVLTGAGGRAPTSPRALPRSERSARRATSEDTAAR